MRHTSVRNQRGFSIVEVLIALAILGIIAGAFLIALANASNVTGITDMNATAESLARSQMESIKREAYLDHSKTPGDALRPNETYTPITLPSGFSLTLEVVPFDPETEVDFVKAQSDPDVYNLDHDIQRITITVFYQGDQKIVLVGYKVNR